MIDKIRIQEEINPILSAHSVELVDIEWIRENSCWILRIFIEKEGTTSVSGNVSLDDCAEVSKDVSTVLDVADLIQTAYVLEVSSPGLERKLVKWSDFERFIGKLAKVKLSKPASDGQKVLRGEILSSNQDLVCINVDGKIFSTPYSEVEEARLIFEPLVGKKTLKKNKKRDK